MPVVDYQCLGKRIDSVERERTILDISVANKIPHWRECGGHAQCTTCRVRVIDGLANLSPRTEAEQALAATRGWAPSTRLACQARVRGNVTLERIVLHGADTSQLQLETVGVETGEERHLAIIFCDMRGFTGLAESHSAFDVVHILNRFFTALGEPVLLNGGIIYQYVGDEISGLFGLDGGSPERACRAALRAALGMLDALDDLNNKLETEFGVRIAVGVGVHYGPVIVGRVGHPTHRQFSVVGDNVNMASRIQAMNKSLETRLLVSDSVIHQLPPGALDIGRATSTQLRGRQDAVRLHAVSGFAELDPFLLVQRTLGRLLGDPGGFSSRLYQQLFAADPDIEPLFVNGVQAQGQMLEYMLRSVIFGLGRSNYLAMGLHALGAEHVAYGVQPKHYDSFRQAMLDTIADMLGPGDFSAPVAEAWASTIDMMLGLMKRGAAAA